MTSSCPYLCPRPAPRPTVASACSDFIALSLASSDDTLRFEISSPLAPAVAPMLGRARSPAVGERPTIPVTKDPPGAGVGLGLRPRIGMPANVLARAGRENPWSEVSKFRRAVRNDLAGSPQ
jgi:hypothetical protein